MSHRGSRVRLIGIGSPFGADGIGWRVIEVLRVQLGIDHVDGCVHVGPHEVRIDITDRPGVELLRYFEQADWVIVVDAVVARDRSEIGGSWPRWLQRAELEALPSMCSSHAMGVAEALALGAALGSLPCKVSILGFAVDSLGDFEFETAHWAGAVETGVEMILRALSTMPDSHPQAMMNT